MAVTRARRRLGERDPASPQERDASTPFDSVLELQATAGNAAVARALARTPTATPTPPKPKPIQSDVAAGHILTTDEQKDLPTVGDTPGLVQERAELAAKIKKAEEEKQAPDPKDVARRDEIERKLRVRVKGDEAETLRVNGITGGAEAWFAEVRTQQFLGKSVTVHRILAERLKRAEDALANETPPKGGWLTEQPSSLRKPGESLHSLGLAIDLNPSRNPWLIDPSAPNASLVEAPKRSKAIRGVIDNAILLVLGKTPKEADFQSRPSEKDKDRRVEASYDKLAEASGALARYFELDKPQNAAELDQLATATAAKDPAKRTAAAWRRTIAADRATLALHGGGKSWAEPHKGFLSLDKKLVKAMTDSAGAGLTWLGDDTVAFGRDIMHFDTRGIGPIKKIWKSTLGYAIGLGDG